MKTLVIRRREPFEVIFLALLALTATTQLALGAHPGSLIALLPGWVSTLWATVTLLDSLTTFIECFYPENITGLFMERLGITISAYTIIIYAGAVSVVGGTRGLVTIALCVSVAVPLCSGDERSVLLLTSCPWQTRKLPPAVTLKNRRERLLWNGP